jgi:hypothetical protein
MIDNEACYSLPIQWLVVGRDIVASLVLLELNGLEETTKVTDFLTFMFITASG